MIKRSGNVPSCADSPVAKMQSYRGARKQGFKPEEILEKGDIKMKIALPAGSQAAEDYLEMAKVNGFDWFDVGGASPLNFP